MRAKNLLSPFLALFAAGFLRAESPSPTMEAWAMLWQMMDRLRAEVAQHELSAVHFEDPVVNAAVAKLLSDAAISAAPNNGLVRLRLVELVRDIAALHTAADAADENKCLELMRKAHGEFQQLQSTADRALMQRAREYAERYTCAMHPGVIGAKDAACPNCGMPLDQLMVLMPTQTGSETLAAPQVVAQASRPTRLCRLASAPLPCSICAAPPASRCNFRI